MPLDDFTSHLGVAQGRINPTHHQTSVDPDGNVIDGTRATLLSGSTEPFALSEGAEFLIIVDMGEEQRIVFATPDFADITNATAAEVSAAIESHIEAAKLISTAEPYSFTDGDTLLIRVDNGPDQTATMSAADFADISAATAVEVATVLNAAWTGLTASEIAGRVYLESDSTGTTAELHIQGGLANDELGFSTLESHGSTPVTATDVGGQVQLESDLVGALGCLNVSDPLFDNANQVLNFPLDQTCGVTGGFSFVFGFDSPGHVVSIEPGDFIQIEQAGIDFEDADVMHVRGFVRIPESLPSTYSWSLRLEVNGYIQVLALAGSGPNAYPNIEQDGYTLIDFGTNVSQLGGGPETVSIRLQLGGPAGAADIELPAAYLDVLTFQENAPAMLLLNRNPHPGKIRVPADFVLSLMVLSTNGDAVDTANTTITVDGVVAFSGGAQQNGFIVGSSANVGPSSDDALFIILTVGHGFVSDQEILIEVESQTVGASATLSDSYSYFVDDTVEPTIVAASPRSKKVVRITFDDDVKQESATDADDALNPANYTIDRLSVPAMELSVVSVTSVNSTTVDLTFDTEQTFNALYQVSVTDVVDDAGNAITPPNNTATWFGFVPNIPAGRDFNLFRLLGEITRRDDIDIAEVEPFLKALQEPLDLVLCLIDEWTDILDPDLAPEPFIDAMLIGLGNPFRFDLTLADKRRLLSVLVAIYQSKGTEFGIEDAIFFFQGIEVDVRPLLAFEDGWILGEGELGEDTELFPSNSALRYTFEIISPVTLTDAQRDTMLKIADYMKVGHEHIRLIEPTTITPSNFWILGEGLLGEDTELDEVTIGP
jgi:phage tail-like protein